MNIASSSWLFNLNTALKQMALVFIFMMGLNTMAQVPGPVLEYPKKVLILGGVAHIGNGELIENSAIAMDNGRFLFVKDQMRKRVSATDYDLSLIHI